MRRRFDVATYRSLLDANFQAPWSAVARDGLELFLSGSCGTRSEPEDLWLAAWIATGFPVPFVNNRHALGIAGIESDFYFRDLGKIIEIDGSSSHDKPFMREADRQRDELVAAREIVTKRYAAIDVYRRLDWVIAESARFLGFA